LALGAVSRRDMREKFRNSMNGVADFETMLSRELESFRCGSDAAFLIGVVPVAQQVTKENSKEMDSSAFLFQEGDSADLLRL
jgi:hypothetical protein